MTDNHDIPISAASAQELGKMAARGLNPKEQKFFLAQEMKVKKYAAMTDELHIRYGEKVKKLEKDLDEADQENKELSNFNHVLTEQGKRLAEEKKALEERVEILMNIRDAQQLILQSEKKYFKREDFEYLVEFHDIKNQELATNAIHVLRKLDRIVLEFLEKDEKIVGKFQKERVHYEKSDYISFINEQLASKKELLEELLYLQRQRGPDHLKEGEEIPQMLTVEQCKRFFFDVLKMNPKETNIELRKKYLELQKIVEGQPDPNKEKIKAVIENIQELDKLIKEDEKKEDEKKESPEEINKRLNEAGMLAEQRSGWGMDPTFSGALATGC